MSAIKKAYPAAKVYGDRLPQGFKEPCFFVLMLEGSQDKELDRSYKRFHPFDIHITLPHIIQSATRSLRG
ncbi:phage tail terminator family protein [Brevibacillus laterosporus]|uniref:phage tail terminator family protein n=1 Tax=Brevibacillus laterosporus TaxID=1465 RepID=UPI003D218E72